MFVEGIAFILPLEAGGSALAITPRDGSYRPFARRREGGPLLRLCFIEGPPRLSPGEMARVVVEIEPGPGTDIALVPGSELELIEWEPSAIGVLTVSRVWRDIAISA
ncbi:MAG TPA: hypothetical protein VMS98_08840 [Thermoanaerobaculia bacterium]|nr:hypothetical protein [Thermoanaerobaculia bacterium]